MSASVRWTPSWQGAAFRLPCRRSDGDHHRDPLAVPGRAVRALAAPQDAAGGIVSLVVGNGLTHWFGRELALEGVDLVLATALRPTSGLLQIAGLNAFRERRRLRHYLGYVAHAPGLYPALTAAENLEF